MKKVFVCFLFLVLLAVKSASAQSSVIKLNSINDADSLATLHFAYPDYQDGLVFFFNKGITPGKLNYNRLRDEVFFRNKNNELALNKLETVEKISIGSDTFLVSPVGGFVKQIAAYPQLKLVKKSTLKYLDRERKVAYGGYSSTTGTRAVTTLPEHSQTTQKISVDENISYTLTDTYYLLIPTKKLLKINQKSLFALYPDNKKELQTYFSKNRVNFNKEVDLNSLLLYTQSFK